jgi:outer membrane lipoprotein-sorting protein
MLSRIPAACALAVALLALWTPTASAASSKRKKKLTRQELVALFADLSKAAKTARTFQGAMTRTEQSGFVLDEEPLKAKGHVWIARPDCFRQDIEKPRPSVTVASKEHLWVYFPAAREAQHVNIRKGVKGRADTTTESIMPWLTFDLPGLEKKYKIRARRTAVPTGVKIKTVPAPKEGTPPPKIEKIKSVPPANCYRIEFKPKEAKYAPNLAVLYIWVDGINPWPLRIERETVDGDLQTTAFGEVTLEAPVDKKRFDFRPPAGTKIVELSE